MTTTTEPTRRPRSTPAERERAVKTMRKQYEKGATVRDLADQSGRSYGWVHRLLVEAGVEMRQRGGNVRAKKKGS